MYEKFLAILLLGFASAQTSVEPTHPTQPSEKTLQTKPTHATTTKPEDFPVFFFQKECFTANMGLRVKEKGKGKELWTMRTHESNVTCTKNLTVVDIKETSRIVSLKFTKDNTKYYLSSIIFYNHSLSYSHNKLKLFSTNFNTSFKCYNQPMVELKKGDSKIDLEFKKLKFEIFQGNTPRNFSSTVNECSEDKRTSNIVPIVVGAVLTGMIVIVLIAYLIGRRNNKSGYESV